MSRVNIKKSTLINSPVTATSSSPVKKEAKKKFFDKPYVKGIVITVVGGILVLFIWSLITNSKDMQNDGSQPKISIIKSKLEKSPIIVDSPGATVSISDTDSRIQSISVEAKLLATKKPGAENPPRMVNLMAGFGNAKLKDGSTEETLLIQSPVYFNQQDNDLEIINNFALQPGSQLQHQYLKNIKKFQTLSVPIVTVVYGNAIETMKKLSVSMKINGKMVFSKEWIYNTAFQNGSTFSIPLEWTTIEEPK